MEQEELFIFEQNGYSVTEQMVPMRGGVRLYTRCILPKAGGKCPVIFTRTPYDPQELPKPFGVAKTGMSEAFCRTFPMGMRLSTSIAAEPA